MALNTDTIPAMVAQRVAAHGAETILRKKDRGIWKAESWAELGAHIRNVAAALQTAGFATGDVACTLAETRPEWVYVDLGILLAGGVSGGIRPEDDADRVGEILRVSGCSVLFVENDEQLDKVLAVREQCPALRRIVIFDMKGLRDFVDPMCESFAAFVARGAEQAGDWDRALAAVTPDQRALLLFPAEGRPAYLTHAEVLQLIGRARPLLAAKHGDERLALLPMDHVMERVFGLYVALDTRAVSNYLESSDTELENLQEVQPTLLGTSRALWERLYTRASTAATSATPLQAALCRWAVAAGQRGGLMGTLARLLVLRAVRRELGLARLRLAYLGDETLPPEIERWTMALGIAIQPIDSRATQDRAMDQHRRASMAAAYGT